MCWVVPMPSTNPTKSKLWSCSSSFTKPPDSTQHQVCTHALPCPTLLCLVPPVPLFPLVIFPLLILGLFSILCVANPPPFPRPLLAPGKNSWRQRGSLGARGGGGGGASAPAAVAVVAAALAEGCCMHCCLLPGCRLAPHHFHVKKNAQKKKVQKKCKIQTDLPLEPSCSRIFENLNIPISTNFPVTAN